MALIKKTAFQDPTTAKTTRSNFTEAHTGGGVNEPGDRRILPDLHSLILAKRYQVSRYYAGSEVTSAEWVEQLAALLADDTLDLDPIDVFEIDGQLWVAHGYSRTAAYKLAGRTAIPAILHPGGHAEAMKLALRANAKSQKATTLDDKWAHCWHTLVFYGFAQSDKQLAKFVDYAFSYGMVKTVRDAHQALLRVWKQYGRTLPDDKIAQLCDGVPAHFVALVREYEWDNLPLDAQDLPVAEEPQPQIRIAHRTVNGKESVYPIDTTAIGQHKKGGKDGRKAAPLAQPKPERAAQEPPPPAANVKALRRTPP
jgi:hypothetical protein